MEIKPRLIIGLGNPGKEYEKTYHNVGFLFVDYLTASHCQSFSSVIARSEATRQSYKIALPLSGSRNDKSLAMTLLLKSDVYMNQSGNFVKAALKKYKIKPEETLIVHDDSDIELGKYKISFGRGSAGHRGIQSIIDSLKTKNFRRLRIGIRKKTGEKAEKFVLKKISKNDLKVFKKVFQNVIANEICHCEERSDEAISEIATPLRGSQ